MSPLGWYPRVPDRLNTHPLVCRARLLVAPARGSRSDMGFLWGRSARNTVWRRRAHLHRHLVANGSGNWGRYLQCDAVPEPPYPSWILAAEGCSTDPQSGRSSSQGLCCGAALLSRVPMIPTLSGVRTYDLPAEVTHSPAVSLPALTQPSPRPERPPDADAVAGAMI